MLTVIFVRHLSMSQSNRCQCMQKYVQVGMLIVDWTLHQLIKPLKAVLLQQDVRVLACSFLFFFR